MVWTKVGSSSPYSSLVPLAQDLHVMLWVSHKSKGTAPLLALIQYCINRYINQYIFT